MLPMLVLLILTIWGKFYFRNWLAPGVFFSLIWLLYTIFPIIFLPDLPISSFSLWIITFSVFSLVTGSMLVFPISNHKLIVSKESVNTELFYSIFFKILKYFSILSFLGVILIFEEGIRSYGLPKSLESIFHLGYFYAYARYRQSYVPPLGVRILSYFIYPSALAGGYLWNYFKNLRKKFLSVLPLLIMSFYSIIFAARAGLYISIFMWISGVLVSNLLKHGEKYKVFYFKKLFLLIVVFFVLIFSYCFIQVLRIGKFSQEIFTSIIQNAKVAIWGYLPAFSVWLDTANLLGFSGGNYTFAGLFDLLGLGMKQQGLYSPVYFPTGESTNIYTMFRALIEDYSIVGMFIFWFVVGILSTLAYVKTCNGKLTWSIILSAFYSMSFFSNLYSIFIFNSVLFSWGFVVTLGFMIKYSRIFKEYSSDKEFDFNNKVQHNNSV